MDLKAEKIELAKMILDTDNPKIINAVKRLFSKETDLDIWDELSVEQQQEIEIAQREVREGKVTDYDNFIAKHRDE